VTQPFALHPQTRAAEGPGQPVRCRSAPRLPPAASTAAAGPAAAARARRVPGQGRGRAQAAAGTSRGERTPASKVGVRLAQKMQVGQCIPMRIQL
jgi:hypothetical protein